MVYEKPHFPDKMPNEWGTVTILRKMSGEAVSSSYKDALEKLAGAAKYDDFTRSQKFGLFLSTVRNSKKSSDDFAGCEKIFKDKEFARDYRNFADKYLSRLEEIANMPKEAYNKAFQYIDEADGYAFDFKNPDNIMIDTEKQEFNFVDLQFNPAILCYYECDDAKTAFRDLLLGGRQFYAYNLDYPAELLVKTEDLKRFSELKRIIDKKCGLDSGVN